MRKSVEFLLMAAATVLAATPSVASASVLWDGSASGRSAKDTFGILNCVAPGSITAATDPTRAGMADG